MRMTDHDSRQDCRVIPFVRPVTSEENVVTSSIAAVIAVTILHSPNESPEDRLLDILEQSGDVEVLDPDEAMDELAASSAQLDRTPANDNTFMLVR